MSSFLNELAKPQPIPGGGAASAQAALTGLALVTKVIALEAARPGQSPERQEPWLPGALPPPTWSRSRIPETGTVWRSKAGS